MKNLGLLLVAGLGIATVLLWKSHICKPLSDLVGHGHNFCTATAPHVSDHSNPHRFADNFLAVHGGHAPHPHGFTPTPAPVSSPKPHATTDSSSIKPPQPGVIGHGAAAALLIGGNASANMAEISHHRMSI